MVIVAPAALRSGNSGHVSVPYDLLKFWQAYGEFCTTPMITATKAMAKRSIAL
jgi:hypothetical protein